MSVVYEEKKNNFYALKIKECTLNKESFYFRSNVIKVKKTNRN